MKTLKEILEALFDNDTDSNINVLPRLYKRLMDKNPGAEKTRELLEDIIKNYPDTKLLKNVPKKGTIAVFDSGPIRRSNWESLFVINIDAREVMTWYDLSNLSDTAYGVFDEREVLLLDRGVIYKIPEKLYLEFQELFNEYN